MSYLKHKPGSIEEMMANNAKKLNDNAYQQMFKKELDKAGKGIGSMSPKEKKDFFNKIDSKYKAKDEGFASDAQRKAAFASGYKEKGDKKEDLNKDDSKIGAAGLVMAIVGGALLPRFQAQIIDLGGNGVSDLNILGLPEVNISFILPLICFIYIAIYSKLIPKFNNS